MFGLFKGGSKKEKLEKKHKKILEEAFKLQSINRRDSDAKYAEAEEIMKQIEALQN